MVALWQHFLQRRSEHSACPCVRFPPLDVHPSLAQKIPPAGRLSRINWSARGIGIVCSIACAEGTAILECVVLAITGAVPMESLA